MFQFSKDDKLCSFTTHKYVGVNDRLLPSGAFKESVYYGMWEVFFVMIVVLAT